MRREWQRNCRRGTSFLIRLCLLAASGLILVLHARDATAELPSATALIDCRQPNVHPTVRCVRSTSLVIHTDLPDAAVQELIDRLEQTLKVVAKYFGRAPKGTLECFVVGDLENWSDASLKHPLARVVITGVGGATIGTRDRAGDRWVNKATVYCSDRPGIAEHEIVHAYCSQTFGATGPDWFKEGFAEMIHHQRLAGNAVNCPPAYIVDVRDERQVGIPEIVGKGRFTRGIADVFAGMLNDSGIRDGDDRCVPVRYWLPHCTESVVAVKPHYHRAWALCHFLYQNPNYSQRFRVLSKRYVSQSGESFQRLFGSAHRELCFEYDQFVRNIGLGYRVDKCRWNWNARFQPCQVGRTVSAEVQADEGYQPSGLVVTAGREYDCTLAGQWSTEADGPWLDARDSETMDGPIEAVIFDEYHLGSPFELTAGKSFISQQSGKLYLRCRDDWCGISDNRGSVRVRISIAANAARDRSSTK